VSGQWGTVAFDPQQGGAAVAATDDRGHELLAGPSLTAASHLDSGGLWRLGQEIHGGRWTLLDDTARHPATVSATVRHGGRTVEVRVLASCEGREVALHHTIDAATAAVVTRTSLRPRWRRSVSLVIRPAGTATAVTMHQPGAVLRRPLQRWYEPTFWPLHSFAVTRPPTATTPGVRLGCATAAPTALHVAGDGTAEILVARAPFKELAFRVVPVMAPAWGRPAQVQSATLAWSLHGPAAPASTGHPTSTGHPASTADDVRLGRSLVAAVDRAAGRPAPCWPVEVGDPDVEVIAAKPADRGVGIVVRLRDWAAIADGGADGTRRVVRLRPTDPDLRIDQAWVAD
ncbi:MAG: hypothetical protein JST64_14915, partial [Actinobacteria bacterium]|nr:hypothetical protein [Actinomycetota bacterium]